MGMELDHYHDNLNHVAEPDTPTERQSKASLSLEGWKALYLASWLEDFAHYGTTEEQYHDVALAYAEYVRHRVYNDQASMVDIYAHTDVAADTLGHTSDYIADNEDDVEVLCRLIVEMLREFAETVLADDVLQQSRAEGAQNLTIQSQSIDIQTPSVDDIAGFERVR